MMGETTQSDRQDRNYSEIAKEAECCYRNSEHERDCTLYFIAELKYISATAFIFKISISISSARITFSINHRFNLMQGPEKSSVMVQPLPSFFLLYFGKEL